MLGKRMIRSAATAAIAAAMIFALAPMQAGPAFAAEENDMDAEHAGQSVKTVVRDSEGSVTRLELGSEYKGSLGLNEEKTFSFTTSGNDSYYDISIVNSNADFALEAGLYDKDWERQDAIVILENERKHFSYLPNGKDKLAKNATYYFVLRAAAPGDFVIDLNEIKDDYPNDYTNATSIAKGSTRGRLEVEPDQDWMVFKAPSAGKYRFKFINGNSGSRYIYNVYDKDVARIGSASVWGNKTATEEYDLSKGQVRYISFSDSLLSDPCGYTLRITKVKLANTMRVSTKTITLKASTLAKKKKTVKGITVKKAKGKVTYTKKKGYGSGKLSVAKKSGKITVKKGTKAGVYKIKVKVHAAGDSNYKSKNKTVTVIVKVK